jgi:membrane protein
MFGGLALKELAKRVWREANADNVFGRAAELAYYFLLALFPMLIFLTAMVGFLPGLRENIMESLAAIVPGDAMALVRETLKDVTEHSSTGLLSFGILGTLWAASNGVAAVMGTLNTAYDAKESRPWLKMRLVATGLTVGLALLVVGGVALIMFADRLAGWASTALGVGPVFETIWQVVHYLLGLALLFIGIEVIYYFGPNVEQSWRWITPGAVFAVIAIILGSLGLSIYLRFAPAYSATYGSLGAVIILMLWLYILGLVLLLGGEINSEIEQAAGKPQVEKEPPDHLQAA